MDPNIHDVEQINVKKHHIQIIQNIQNNKKILRKRQTCILYVLWTVHSYTHIQRLHENST